MYHLIFSVLEICGLDKTVELTLTDLFAWRRASVWLLCWSKMLLNIQPRLYCANFVQDFHCTLITLPATELCGKLWIQFMIKLLVNIDQKSQIFVFQNFDSACSPNHMQLFAECQHQILQYLFECIPLDYPQIILHQILYFHRKKIITKKFS